MTSSRSHGEPGVGGLGWRGCEGGCGRVGVLKLDRMRLPDRGKASPSLHPPYTLPLQVLGNRISAATGPTLEPPWKTGCGCAQGWSLGPLNCAPQAAVSSDEVEEVAGAGSPSCCC